ncbi:DUF378 domain-containing protein [Clostridium sp. Maddingley MBC34-26]
MLDKLSFLLIFIGSLNWGTIGLFNLNLVSIVFLNNILMQRAIYILISLAAANIISLIFRCNLIFTDK